MHAGKAQCGKSFQEHLAPADAAWQRIRSALLRALSARVWRKLHLFSKSVLADVRLESCV